MRHFVVAPITTTVPESAHVFEQVGDVQLAGEIVPCSALDMIRLLEALRIGNVTLGEESP